MSGPPSDPSVKHRTAHALMPPLLRLQDAEPLDRNASLQRSPRKRVPVNNSQPQHANSTHSSKRLRPDMPVMNDQAPHPPDPLDADPFALMAAQSHLLESGQLPQMQRGNSSSVRDLQRLPTPNITDLEVGLPDAAGSSGKAEVHNESQDRKQDKCPNVDPALQQLQQLKNNFDAAKAQHRLQLQERNRQIGHLQEDRERARKLLKKAEGDVRDAQDLVLCTVCKQNNRNCLILPCLHYLLCAGCLQQHTATCPFCPACKTKVSGLLVVLTSI